ncbi:MAG: hypothetical protein KAT70_01920, partial [Thermoplasmata archaeon]|nr:hypothetical protein [Thermoplasmata archaeon]
LVLAGSILLLFAAFMEMRSSCALSSSPTAPEVTVVSSTPAPASISLDSIEASSWGSEEANVATPPLETPISSSASEKDGKIGEGAIEEATTEKPEEREEEKPAKKGLFSKLPFGKKKAAPDTEPTSAGTEHAPEPVLIEPASSEQVESRYKAPETPFAPPVSAIMLKREGKDEEEGNLIRWARHRNTDGKAFEKCMKCDTYQFIEVKEDGKHVNFTCPSCGAKWRLGK